MTQTYRLPGLNIQSPWSQLIIEGRKSIETRTYPIPKKYIDNPMWLIETPGKLGKFKARVIGIVTFSGSKEYLTAFDFYSDSEKHLIYPDNETYAFNEKKKKFGWIVSEIKPMHHFPAPTKKGIVYASPFTNPSD